MAKIAKIISPELAAKFLESSGGFNRVLHNIKIISAGDGKCTAELKVSAEDSNHVGTLHGGLSATLVDCITSCAVVSHNSYPNIPSVSINMNISYLKGAAIGDEIVIDATTKKIGKNMGFLNCEIRNKKTGDLLVEGSHTVFFVQPKDKKQ